MCDGGGSHDRGSVGPNGDSQDGQDDDDDDDDEDENEDEDDDNDDDECIGDDGCCDYGSDVNGSVISFDYDDVLVTITLTVILVVSIMNDKFFTTY